MSMIRVIPRMLQHKLCLKSCVPFIKTQKYLSSCSKVTRISLLSNHVLLKASSPFAISSRTFWETFPSIAASFYQKDGLNTNNYELVYHSRFFNYAFYSQLVSQSVFAVQIVYSLIYAGCALFAHEFVPLLTEVGPFKITHDLISLTILMAFTVQNALLFNCAQKVLLRVYHKKDTDEYVFASLSFNPFATRHTIIKPGELKFLFFEDLRVILTGNYLFKDRKYYLREEHFKDIYHFRRLMNAHYQD